VFVHLGGEVVVDVRDVVAVIDVRRPPKGELARDLLDRARAMRPDVDDARAIVITTKGIFLSTISSDTLANRVRRMLRSGRSRTARKQTGQGFPPLTLNADRW
jgi:hypothetical protein